MTMATAAAIAKKPESDIQLPPDKIKGERRIRLAKTPMIRSKSPALQRIEIGARSSISSVSTSISAASISRTLSSTLSVAAALCAVGASAAGIKLRDEAAGFVSGGSLFVSKPFFSIFNGETSIGFGDGFTVAFCPAGRGGGSLDFATTLKGKLRAAAGGLPV